MRKVKKKRERERILSTKQIIIGIVYIEPAITKEREVFREEDLFIFLVVLVCV
mgnify:CR=1 FL=1